MGCTASNETEAAESKRIEIQLQEDRKRIRNEIKILLLGAGESGKSTIAKQLKIINAGDFSESERKEWKRTLTENTFLSLKTLVLATQKFGLEVKPEIQPTFEKFAEVNLHDLQLSSEAANHIQKLWEDPAIQQTYSRRAEFQLSDNAKYCLDNVLKFSEEGYVPTQEDILHCRVRTTGVIESEFNMGPRRLRLLDVGGQRAERRKWISCFDDVTAVIFCIAISEYDQKLAEDENVNRLHEAMSIFQELVTKWFLKTTIVLFLNKSDLFRQKIQKVDLNVCFPEYEGGLSYDKGVAFITNRLVSMDRFEDSGASKRKRLYPHVTCATDTSSVRTVFEAVKETLVGSNLATAGLI